MNTDPRDACPELWEENRRLRALVDLGRLMADPNLELAAKLQRCVEALAGLLGAEGASLMLAEGESLVVRAATNQAILGMTADPAGDSIASRAARAGAPVYVKDVLDSALASFARQGDRSTYRTGSLISLPLIAGGRLAGVLNLADKEGEPHFGEDDLALARNIAAQVSYLVDFSALHDRLETAYRRLRRAQRAKDDLMYMIFHDMKAPLASARELLLLLEAESGLDDEERADHLALAQGDLELLWGRVTNLLDLNRMDSDEFPVNLEAVSLDRAAAEAAARLAAVSRAHGVSVQVEESPPLEAAADEDLVERILSNLLFNAVKFSAPEAGGGGLVRVRALTRGGMALVEIGDTGPGVDPELGQGVFERYKQGRVTKGSSGLGLYFCRRAAWLLGGDVSYENLPGGAVFTLRLPLEA